MRNVSIIGEDPRASGGRPRHRPCLCSAAATTAGKRPRAAERAPLRGCRTMPGARGKGCALPPCAGHPGGILARAAEHRQPDCAGGGGGSPRASRKAAMLGRDSQAAVQGAQRAPCLRWPWPAAWVGSVGEAGWKERPRPLFAKGAFSEKWPQQHTHPTPVSRCANYALKTPL